MVMFCDMIVKITPPDGASAVHFQPLVTQAHQKDNLLPYSQCQRILTLTLMRMSLLTKNDNSNDDDSSFKDDTSDDEPDANNSSMLDNDLAPINDYDAYNINNNNHSMSHNDNI